MATLREDALAIRQAALDAIAPGPLVRAHLPDLAGPVWVYGAGKAAVAMARAVEEALGDRVRGGLVVAPTPGELARIEVAVGAHPVPDARSEAAGRRLLAEVAARSAGDEIVGVWSGGASALMEVPADGLDLAEIGRRTREALADGVDIERLNALRRTWSAVKGGKLADAGPARWVNLVLSDVAGDDPALVGSGPAIRPGDDSVVIGSNATAVDAALAEARRRRYAVLSLDRDLRGEARVAGERLAAAIRAMPEVGRPPMALILGGEPVVSGVGPGVTGGRMQELALAAALGLEGVDAVVVATSTDGVDGPTDAAGAVVDGDTAARIRAAGLDPADALARHDSGTALAAAGALLSGGWSGTNVRDVVIALVGSTLSARTP